MIGIFNCRSSTKRCHISNLNQNFVSMFEVLFYCWPFFESTFIFLSSLLYILIILQCHGDNFQKLLNDIENCKPSLSIVTGDFNSRCSSWWPNDINTPEGLKLYSLTSLNGFSQLIHKPTHIQANSSLVLT